MTTTAKFCKQLKKTGQQCRAYAGANSEYCFYHDPAKAAQRAAAHSAGGHARHGRTIGPVEPGAPVTLATVADVVKLLESEVNHVLGLEVSLSRAQTISRLALSFIKAFEVSEMEGQLAAMEQRLAAVEGKRQ